MIRGSEVQQQVLLCLCKVEQNSKHLKKKSHINIITSIFVTHDSHLLRLSWLKQFTNVSRQFTEFVVWFCLCSSLSLAPPCGRSFSHTNSFVFVDVDYLLCLFALLLCTFFSVNGLFVFCNSVKVSWIIFLDSLFSYHFQNFQYIFQMRPIYF